MQVLYKVYRLESGQYNNERAELAVLCGEIYLTTALQLRYIR